MDKEIRELLKDANWMITQAANLCEFDEPEYSEDCFAVCARIEKALTDESKDTHQ